MYTLCSSSKKGVFLCNLLGFESFKKFMVLSYDVCRPINHYSMAFFLDIDVFENLQF